MRPIVGVSFGSEFGGHERAAADLLMEMGRFTSVLMLCDTANVKLLQCCQTNNLKFQAYNNRMDLLRRLLELRSKYRLIFLPGNLFIGSVESFLCKLTGMSISVYIPYYLDHEKLNGWLLGRLKNRLQFGCLRSYSDAITISQAAKQGVLMAQPGKNVYLVSNKIPKFERRRATSNTDYDCLLIGRIYFKQKGQDRAIEFLERFSRVTGRRLTVAIAGEGVDENRLERMLKRTTLNTYELLGYCRNTAELYSNSKVVLVPSRFEGVPFVILEALSAEVAMVVSDIPVFRHLVGDEHTVDFDSDDFSLLEKALEPDFCPLRLDDLELESYNEVENYLNEDNFRRSNTSGSV